MNTGWQVIHWANGMVMVFGPGGQQLTKYQGWYEEVAEAIRRDAPRTTIYYSGVWGTGGAPKMMPVPRGEF